MGNKTNHIGAFLSEKVDFAESDLEELECICEKEAFVDAVSELAGLFKGLKLNELNRPLIKDQRAALTKLEELTDGLTSALLNLDSDTRYLIVQSLEYNILPSFFLELAKGPLDRLSSGVELARRKIEPKTGAPPKMAERDVAIMLESIFEHFGLEMPMCKGEQSGVGYKTYITGTDFYMALKIVLLAGCPSRSEWPGERDYSQLRESAIEGYVIGLVAGKNTPQ